MKNKDAIRSAAEAAIEKGKEQLQNFERQSGKVLPPPMPVKIAAMAMLREYLFPLIDAMDAPERHSAILQHFLVGIGIPWPKGVFKSDFYDFPQTVLGTPKRGRPRKDDEARKNALLWLRFGRPSFWKFALMLDKGLKQQDIKKAADRLRHQVNSVLAPRELKKN